MKLRAMVRTCCEHRKRKHVWVDYYHRHRSMDALKDELDRGIKNGQWIQWRIIFGWAESGK